MSKLRKPPQRLGFRASFHDKMRANAAGLSQLEALSGKPTPPEQLALQRVGPKVARGPRKPKSTKSESEVQKEIIYYLRRHPAVQLLFRHNSGTAGDSFVKFNYIHLPKRFIGETPSLTPRMRMPDLSMVMIDGRYGVIDAKEECWRRTMGISDKAVREQEQWNLLEHVRACGGIGLFAPSVDVVRKALIAAGYTD